MSGVYSFIVSKSTKIAPLQLCLPLQVHNNTSCLFYKNCYLLKMFSCVYIRCGFLVTSKPPENLIKKGQLD